MKRGKRLGHCEHAETVEDGFALIHLDRFGNMRCVAHHHICTCINGSMGYGHLVIGDRAASRMTPE